MRRLALGFATVGYVGYAPVAPGTVGAAVGVALHALVVRLDPSGVAAVVVAGILAAAGTWAAAAAAHELGQADPRPVVIDEVVGMLVTLGGRAVGWRTLVAGFLLFRLLDVVKPAPAARLERLPGGWGIMADDVTAGLYAHLVLRGVTWLAPQWLA